MIPFPASTQSRCGAVTAARPLRRYWLDILFNDQNATDMSGVLAVAERGYQAARFHYAFMLNDPFARGWCLYEMMVRLLAAMRALGLKRAEDLVPFILRRDPLFTRLVIVDDLSGINEDVTGPYYDRFGTMSTFDPADLARIQQGIVEACGSPAAFNMLISTYRHASIQDFHKVKGGEGPHARKGRWCRRTTVPDAHRQLPRRAWGAQGG